MSDTQFTLKFPKHMNRLIKFEELAMFGFSIYLFNQTEFTWWWFPALILLPDIGMLGYLISTSDGN